MNLKEFAEQLAVATLEMIEAAVAPMRARQETMEAAVKAIPAGPAGKDGKDGARGERGEKGEVGQQGDRGATGVDGKDGAAGLNGKDGAAGRDALQLEILPSIEDGKSYARGSYAKHDGGLWRAFEATHGMRGWECIVGGVSAVVVRQDTERKFFVDIKLSGGEVVSHEFTIPAVIDRGVYREGTVYAKGDSVTWAGSSWIAQVDKPTDKPGVSDQWRLAVKRGRDGKDKA